MATASFQLQQFLPYRLARLAGVVSDSLSGVYREQFDITIPEWRILANLAEHGVLTAKSIGDISSMDKSTVSRAIKLMEEKKLLVRQKDPADNRASHLRLSARGRALFDKLAPRAKQWEARLLETLSAAEYRDLLKILGKLEQRCADIE